MLASPAKLALKDKLILNTLFKVKYEPIISIQTLLKLKLKLDA